VPLGGVIEQHRTDTQPATPRRNGFGAPRESQQILPLGHLRHGKWLCLLGKSWVIFHGYNLQKGISGGFDDHPMNSHRSCYVNRRLDDYFRLNIGYFQGQTLNLLEGIVWHNPHIIL
jgi:hypothetical protein